MTDLQRNALARDISMRLLRASHEDLRIIDRLLTRLEQLRNLSWTRHVATSPHDVDRAFHLVVGTTGDSLRTRCNGSWPATDAVETCVTSPPIVEMCGACIERWTRGRDVDLYGLLDLARDLATEDLIRAELHEAARAEMMGGDS
jgi:hypothetical protein